MKEGEERGKPCGHETWLGEKQTLAVPCMKGAAAAAEAETEIYLRGLLLSPLFYFGGGFGENGRSKICQFL